MEIRELTADDLDAALDNRIRAFGPVPQDEAETWRRNALPAVEGGRYLGAFDGARLVATTRIEDFTQWWHGRPLPMGGIASVTVAPEDRGRGVGRTIMRTALDRCAALGLPISALYPATTRLYRSLGWEHAGALHQAVLPTEALRTIRTAGDVPLRRTGPGDARALGEVIGRVHAATRASGPVRRSEAAVRRWLESTRDFVYLAEDGFVAYGWDGHDISVSHLLAGSEATARALWALVGSSSSIAKQVRAAVAPDDPVFWLLGERVNDEVAQARWMFRVVDPAAAVAGRGFPAGVTLDAVVHVDDPERPASSGPWHLSVSGGSGTAQPAGTIPKTAPALTAGGLSALFAGVPTTTLRRAGILTGPADADDALDAAFHARPYMTDAF
ncbi:GNAT family N-acetyltransferase [Streptosporangium sandarakinum]|uniref:Putative acetyltransferase n=1 Tax=Streptosporangium sandarakinum TaxID=1260955 RepID=A0A852V9P8_9ACTN|nr:GNAT family N-acetyltransferase [Streptosporangium sandarakinum]NYF43983.1 putative acetyltransferase [Streptosporangium sandarakinum]